MSGFKIVPVGRPPMEARADLSALPLHSCLPVSAGNKGIGSEEWRARNGKIKGSDFVPCRRSSSASALEVAALLLLIYSDYSKLHARPLIVSGPRRQSGAQITGRGRAEEDD